MALQQAPAAKSREVPSSNSNESKTPRYTIRGVDVSGLMHCLCYFIAVGFLFFTCLPLIRSDSLNLCFALLVFERFSSSWRFRAHCGPYWSVSYHCASSALDVMQFESLFRCRFRTKPIPANWCTWRRRVRWLLLSHSMFALL